ncbi:MAG TPA: hypothetical protein VF022_07450 [Rhodanobacteraceae bacterium]
MAIPSRGKTFLRARKKFGWSGAAHGSEIPVQSSKRCVAALARGLPPRLPRREMLCSCAILHGGPLRVEHEAHQSWLDDLHPRKRAGMDRDVPRAWPHAELNMRTMRFRLDGESERVGTLLALARRLGVAVEFVERF